MDLTKSADFFHPSLCKYRVHIIGCGAVGSTVTELLARAGLSKIDLYDSDIVEPHNIANQMFLASDIGKEKTVALADHILAINPDAAGDIRVHQNWEPNTRLSGFVFLCVDNIELRNSIVSKNRCNPLIKAFFDFRMRLTDAQHYAADASNPESLAKFIKSMQFTQDESREETPVSACNLTLSVAPTVRTICSLGAANFMNYLNGKGLKSMILSDPFNGTLFVI